MGYLIGQRVIVGRYIGVVTEPEDGRVSDADTVWVRLSGKGYSSQFSASNVSPLPNGEL